MAKRETVARTPREDSDNEAPSPARRTAKLTAAQKAEVGRQARAILWERGDERPVEFLFFLASEIAMKMPGLLARDAEAVLEKDGSFVVRGGRIVCDA